MADDQHELLKHASVYHLSERWGMSKSLQDIPYANFESALKGNWSSNDLFEVWKRILGIYMQNTSPNLPKDKIRENRIVELMLQTLCQEQPQSKEMFFELSLDSAQDQPLPA
jgi:hypothetical protein